MILPWKIEGYTGTVPVKTTNSEVVTEMKKLLNQITIIVEAGKNICRRKENEIYMSVGCR